MPDEEKKEPDFVCGIILMLNKNGAGVHMIPAKENTDRMPTDDDLIMILSHTMLFAQARVNALVTSKRFEQRMEEIRVTDAIKNKGRVTLQ